MNKHSLQALGYRLRGRSKIALGYTLLFMGYGILRLGQAMQGSGGKATVSTKSNTVPPRRAKIVIRYLLATAIAWFFLGGRTSAHEHGIVRWLLFVGVGISIAEGMAWCFAQSRRRHERFRGGSA